jgi:hypothetical protein
MAVHWTSDPAAFTTRDWTALVEADPDGTIFHTPRYLKLYWEEFGATDLQIAEVREGEDTLAAAAFDIRIGELGCVVHLASINPTHMGVGTGEFNTC